MSPISTTADNLPRVMQCPGSTRMEVIPSFLESDNIVRDEGNAAHWLIASVFNKEFTLDELADRTAPNGIHVDADMIEHVGWFLAMLDPLIGHLEIETSFGWDGFQVRGRADYIEYDRTFKSLRIRDFKYGWRLVEPINNWTLIAHAVGWMLKNDVQVDSISFIIDQPRPYHRDGPSRVWTVPTDIVQTCANRITSTLLNPPDILQTGAYCRHCPSMAVCPAARSASLNGIDEAAFVFNEHITNDNMSRELDLLNAAAVAIKQRLDALEELAAHRIKSGNVVPNYSLERKLANTRWKSHIDIDMVKILTGVDCSESKLITPTQAKKKGVSESILKTITERPETGIKLTRIDANEKASRLLGASK